MTPDIHYHLSEASDFADSLVRENNRVRPTPTVETVEVNGHVNDWKQFVTDSEVLTHRITFNLIDGQPDPASIRMESLTCPKQ